MGSSPRTLAGDGVRQNVQLTEAAADHHLWAENYQRPFDAEALLELRRS